MSLSRQKGRNIWQAVIWDRIRKRHRHVSTGTSDRAKALKFETLLRQATSGNIRRDIVARALDDLTGQASRPGPTLAGMWRDSGASHGHALRAAGDWRAFAAWADRMGVTDAAKVNRELAQQYLGTLSGKSAKSVANARGNLRAAWERSGIAGENPFAGRSLVTAGGKSERGRAFTDAEIAAILSQCHGDQTGCVLCGLYTGLRYSDVLALRWQDVQDGFIRLTPSKTKRHGVEVVLPVHKRLAAWLDQAPRTSEWIFPETRAAQRSSAGRTWFGKALKAAGIDVHRGGLATFHSLRHTFVSNLSRAGVPQAVTRRLAGHSNLETSLRYTHDVESLQDGVGRLPSYLPS